MAQSLRRCFFDAVAEVRLASVRTLRRSVRVLLLHRRGNQRGDIALKRLSIVVLALTVFATPARGADPAPAVRLRQMNDASFSLESLKGSVVVLDFWAPWCVPCRTSFPAMDALQRKYEKQGLRFLGLTIDANDDAIIAFLNAVPVDFTILRDASGQAGEAFNVVAMPTTFVLDRQGGAAGRGRGGGGGGGAEGGGG